VKLLVSVRPTVTLKEFDRIAQRIRDLGARTESTFAPLGLIFVLAENRDVLPALRAIEGVKFVHEQDPR
jgi:hypothetical protein